MTTPLTAEQIASVAREVSGKPFDVDMEQVFRQLPNGSFEIWEPYFDTTFAQQRSQALAIVEWLADRIEALPAGHRRFSKMDELLIGINKRDTTALMQMVLEIKHES